MHNTMIAVVFNNTGAAIFVGAKNAEKYIGCENSLINPDLSLVAKAPMRYWVKRGDRVCVADSTDKSMIEEYISSFGKDRNFDPVTKKVKENKKEWTWIQIAAALALGGALLALILQKLGQ